MSNEKVQAEIVKSLESETNYKKIVPNILKEVVASNRSYIFNLIQLSSAILSNLKYDSSTKYWSLLLIKDVMQLNQPLFATSLIESQIMATLEAICLKNPKTDKETELLFGPQANPKYSKRFYILMVECIKVWGQRYKDAKAPLGKYDTIYDGLIKKGVDFPNVYYFFQNKPEPQEAPQPVTKGVPEQNVNKKPADNSTKQLSEFGKAAELQKQKEQQSIAENFSFKQSPALEAEEDEEYDDDLPIMYNAGELEIDESAEDEWEEEGDSMRDVRIVHKKPEPEKLKQQQQPQPKQQPQPVVQEPVKKDEKQKEPEKKKGGILQALGFGVKKSVSEEIKRENEEKVKKVETKNEKPAEVKTPVGSASKKDAEVKANVVEQKPEKQPSKEVVNKVIESPVEKKAVQSVETSPLTKQGGVVYQQPEKSPIKPTPTPAVQQEVIKEGSQALNKSLDKGQSKVVVQQEIKETKQERKQSLNKSIEQPQSKVESPAKPVEDKPPVREKLDINIQLDMKSIEKLGKTDPVGTTFAQGILQKSREPSSGKEVKPPLDPQVVQKMKSDSFVEWEDVVEPSIKNKTSSSRRNSRNSQPKDIREEQGLQSSQFKPKDYDLSDSQELPIESFSEDKEVTNYQLTLSGGKDSKELQKQHNLGSTRKKSEGYYYNSKDTSSQGPVVTDPKAQRRNSESVPSKDGTAKAGPAQGLAFGVYPKFANTQQGIVNNKVVYQEPPVPIQESKNVQKLNQSFEKAAVNNNKPEKKQPSPSLQVEKRKSVEKTQVDNHLPMAGSVAGIASVKKEPGSAASSAKKEVVSAANSAKKELNVSNVQKDEQRGRGHPQSPSTDFVRKRSNSGRAEPAVQDKQVNELQQKYDALTGENMKIKAQLEKMTQKLKEESQKSYLLQERLSTQNDKREQVNTSYQDERRSLSPSKRLTSKTEVPAGLSNTLNGTRTTYSSEFRSYEGSGQKVRGQSPKVEKIRDQPNREMNLTTAYGSFLHKKYALFSDSYPLVTEPGPKTVDNFMNYPRRRNEFNPLATTMLKTEYFQTSWGQDQLWKTQEYVNRSTLTYSDDLAFATSLDKVRSSCLKEKEILFESQELKVESSTFYSPNVTGRLSVVLTFTNKAENALTEFNVHYSKSTRGFIVTQEQHYFDSKLASGKSEFHNLNAELIGHPTEIGFIVVEFRLNDELHRLKMNYPLIITKFMRFVPLSVTDYVRTRKNLLARCPNNVHESEKIQVSDEYMKVLQEHLLSRLTVVPVEDNKVTMHVACFTLGGYSSEYFLRIIVEKEKQLMIIQIVYHTEAMQDAKNLLNKLVFLCDEKRTL